MPQPRRSPTPRPSDTRSPRRRSQGSEPLSPTRPGTRRNPTYSREISEATPCTVWTCDRTPIDPTELWPTPIVKKIVTEFTVPGAHVGLMPWSTGSPDSTDAASATVQDLHRTTHTVAITPTLQPTMPGPARRAETPHGPEAPSADLVIASLPAQRDEAITLDQLALTAAHTLRTGGVLAVLTHSDSRDATLIDRTGDVITACQDADLLYLQHIVALLVPLRDGGFDLDTSTDDGSESERDTPPSERHRRIHADLLIFALPFQREHSSPPPAGLFRD
jgi:hypothetical protein